MEAQDYETILTVLSREIQNKNTSLILNEFEINRLKKKISDLENEIEEAKSKENASVKYPDNIELRKG